MKRIAISVVEHSMCVLVIGYDESNIPTFPELLKCFAQIKKVKVSFRLCVCFFFVRRTQPIHSVCMIFNLQRSEDILL